MATRANVAVVRVRSQPDRIARAASELTTRFCRARLAPIAKGLRRCSDAEVQLTPPDLLTPPDVLTLPDGIPPTRLPPQIRRQRDCEKRSRCREFFVDPPCRNQLEAPKNQ
jgi:hypothetical protein